MLLRSLCACVLLSAAASANDRLIPVPDPISTPTATISSVPDCDAEYAVVTAAINAYFSAANDYLLAFADRDVAQADFDACILAGGTCAAEAADLATALGVVVAATDQLSDATVDFEDAHAAHLACIGGSGNHEILAPIQWQIMSIR